MFKKTDDLVREGVPYLHWRAHGVEEVDNNEGEDGEPLLPRETGHGNVLSPDGLKFEPNIMHYFNVLFINFRSHWMIWKCGNV